MGEGILTGEELRERGITPPFGCRTFVKDGKKILVIEPVDTDWSTEEMRKKGGLYRVFTL